MKKGEVFYDDCPNCGADQVAFERVADGSYWHSCPECGWEITDESETLKAEDDE